MDNRCTSPETPYVPFEGECGIIERLRVLVNSISERRDLICNALAYTEGTHTFDDIVNMIMTNRVLWWPLPNSFLITEILHYPRKKYLHVFLAGGDLTEIKSMNDELKRAAKLAGCAGVSLAGRRGWVKALKDIGWQESTVTVLTTIDQEG